MLPTKPTPRTRATTEHDEQKKLIHIIRNELAPKYPILEWLAASQNGISLSALTPKERGKITTQMDNEGRKKGIPDLFLPVRSAKYSGLYIEMKSKTGELSPQQQKFKIFAESQGFKWVMPRSCDEALREILDYCGIIL